MGAAGSSVEGPHPSAGIFSLLSQRDQAIGSLLTLETQAEQEVSRGATQLLQVSGTHVRVGVQFQPLQIFNI